VDHVYDTPAISFSEVDPCEVYIDRDEELRHRLPKELTVHERQVLKKPIHLPRGGIIPWGGYM